MAQHRGFTTAFYIYERRRKGKLAQQLGASGRAFVGQYSIGKQVEAWHRTFKDIVQPAVKLAGY